MKTIKSTHTQRRSELLHFATLCCWRRVTDEDLSHASVVRCSSCGRPAVVLDFLATPEFADALYNAPVVHSPKSVVRLLGPDWKQITPWQTIGKHPSDMQRLWYEHGADLSAVVPVRHLGRFALFVRQDAQ